MVAHHLAKVRVASSNLVIRSSGVVFTVCDAKVSCTVAWPRGEAAACKAVHTGSNPVATSKNERQFHPRLSDWRSGSALP